jgi:hypothetical protein
MTKTTRVNVENGTSREQNILKPNPATARVNTRIVKSDPAIAP